MRDFEKNRQDILNKFGRKNSGKKTGNRARPQVKKAPVSSSSRGNPGAAPKSSKKVLLFGSKSIWRGNIAGILSGRYSVNQFDDPEAAIEFGLDNSDAFVILDMDKPTDWRMSTDVFTNLRTMNPDIPVALCSMEPSAVPVATLQAQNALIIKKPVNSEELFEFIT